MPSEIELKLSVLPKEVQRLTASPALAAVRPQRFKLFNTYYDTPALDLSRRGIALRLRRKARNTWLMTVKGGDSGAGGLAHRDEWEAPTQPGEFDFDIVTDADLCSFLKTHAADLRPVFSTDFMRTTWLVEYSGGRIEVALDRGKIDAVRLDDGVTSASEPICELELELIEGGSSDALFGLAIELASDVRLHPAIASKAERGYALAAPTTVLPANSEPSPIARGMTTGEAYRLLALSCVLQLQRNEPGVLAGEGAEYLHQARVAIRRLRSAFRTFGPALTPAFIKTYAPRWAELGRRLGGSRDWDVFLAETLTPLEAAFPDDGSLVRLRERSLSLQAEARAAAVAILSSEDYSRLLLAFSAALWRCEPPTFEVEKKSATTRRCGKRAKHKAKYDKETLRRFASARLQKNWAAVRHILRHWSGKANPPDDAVWHRLRIALKRLRYGLEFFAPLLPRKRLRRYLVGLTAIQDLLGKFNDQAIAVGLIDELCVEEESRPLLQGWLAGRKHLLVEALTDTMKHLLKQRQPW